LVLPSWLVAHDTTLHDLDSEARATTVNGARTTLVQGLLGLVALGGILVAVQQLQTDREQFRDDRQQLREQIALTRQGQVADRFGAAVNQLGSAKVEVRLGGIYGLERIAEESSSTRLQAFEVLAAFIRQHTRVMTRANRFEEVSELQRRTPDVQAALTVIGRRTVLPTDAPIDLRNADLRRANLGGANLERALLSGSELQDSNFTNANLRMANLDDAVMSFARFDKAQLQKASFQRALMSGAGFQDTQLQGAILFGADLRTASFYGADLRDANLGAALLKGATHDDGTVWPKGFNWRTRGVRLGP
jgi:hypothetical protein